MTRSSITYSELNKCLQELKQQAANIQVEGDTLTNARIDSSKPGGKSVRNPSTQYRLRVKGQPSRYLRAFEVADVRAAIARSKHLKKVEQGIQHITSQLEQIEKQALAMGLELPKVKSHDCSVMHSSESNEWYTLQKWTDKARKLMGEITLDPASNVEAQSWIEATHYYTKEQDGMNCPWFGCVWLNPPYGKRRLKDGVYGSTAWILKVIAEFEAGNVTQAVLWLRAGGNKGIQALEDKGFPRIVLGRENHAPPGASGRPQKGAGHDTVVYYLGPHIERFRELFGREQ